MQKSLIIWDVMRHKKLMRNGTNRTYWRPDTKREVMGNWSLPSPDKFVLHIHEKGQAMDTSTTSKETATFVAADTKKRWPSLLQTDVNNVKAHPGPRDINISSNLIVKSNYTPVGSSKSSQRRCVDDLFIPTTRQFIKDWFRLWQNPGKSAILS